MEFRLLNGGIRGDIKICLLKTGTVEVKRIEMMDVSRLLRWYSEHGRHDLPWRQNPTPYHVWISEVMLQQTQVVTVKDYYDRFLQAFPNIVSLASASEEEVLRYWEGLGYYRRARQLHAAAKILQEKYQGKFPTDFSQILALPGIGRYTAGAIASFALGQPYPILEANTQRLFARLLALKLPLATSEATQTLWKFAEDWVGQTVLPGEVNLALMDLGSLVCTPKEPQCEECPLIQECLAFQQGKTAQIPIPKPKVHYESRHEIALILRKSPHSEEICLLRYASGQRWAGLWDFPRTTLPEKSVRNTVLKRFTQETLGLKIQLGKQLHTLRHGVTRYRIFLEAYLAMAVNPEQLATATPHGESIRWVSMHDLHHYPLSSTGRILAEKLLAELEI